jgi:hypothetical protein
MEENTTPTPRPTVNVGTPTRRPMDDFSAPTTPRPVSIPISDSPTTETAKSEPSVSLSPEPTFTATSSVDASQPSESQAPTPVVVDQQVTNPEPSKTTDPGILIPGLNTKPEPDAFKDTPVTLTDTSESKAPEIAEAKTDEKPSTAGVVTSAQYKQPSKKGKGVAILIAVILALGLIAGAGYAYLQNTKEIAPPVTPTTTTQTPAKNPATANDVDTLNTDIDSALSKVDDTKDYQANDLADTTLGL